MHIPSSATTDLAVCDFRNALDEALKPQNDYDASHWLYVPCRYTEYRYILGTRGCHPVVCIGINPSTAEPDNLDNTLKSVERVSSFNGFDSFLMFNIYAQRATDPDDMERIFNPFLHRQNLAAFDYALSLCENGGERPVVWAAWGTIIEKRPFLLSCLDGFLQLAASHNARWVTAGRRSVKKGHPHHPLYLTKTSLFEDFDAASYRAGL